MAKWVMAGAAAVLGWVLAPWVSMWRHGTLDDQRRRSWAHEGRPGGRIPAPRAPEPAAREQVEVLERPGTWTGWSRPTRA